jgi:hypothetical protein
VNRAAYIDDPITGADSFAEAYVASLLNNTIFTSQASHPVLNRGISLGYGPATSVIERRDISGIAYVLARRDVTARNA